MEVIPRDQTSTFPSYWPSSMARITSGAILGHGGQTSKVGATAVTLVVTNIYFSLKKTLTQTKKMFKNNIFYVLLVSCI